MVKGSVFVGIDAGLTSTKAVVVDHAGRTLGTAACPATRKETADGASERDLWEQWADCCEVVGHALRSAGLPGEEVTAIGVTGHGDGLILVDADGEPVRRGILSLDTRARGTVAVLEDDGRAEMIVAETGRPPTSGRPITLLVWIRDNEPESLAAARWILFAKDWIKLRLTGRATTDLSDASAGLLRRSRPEYAYDLLDRLGLGDVSKKLPEIVPSVEVAGVLSVAAASGLGLRAGIPVVSGSHDSSASVVGCAASEPGVACLIAGTWSIDTTVADWSLVGENASKKGLHGRWFLDGDHTILFSSSPSGIGWLERTRSALGLDAGDPDGLVASLFAGDPDSRVGLPVVVPSVRGLGSTRRDGSSVLGVDPSHDMVSIARGLVEAMAFRHRLGCELLSERVPIDQVRVTGGLSRSDSWARFLADSLGREVGRPSNGETGAGGAAAMAGVSAGVWTDVADAGHALIGDASAFEPRSHGKEQIDERYANYQAAVELLTLS